MSRNSAATMVKAMDRAGVRILVFCHHASLFSPDIGNSVNIKAVRKFPDRFRAYCAINPNYPDVVQKDIHSFEQHRDVYVGFKFLADYHLISITDSRYRPAWELADQKGLLILLHTWGGSQYGGPGPIRKMAEKYHRVKILLGHSCHGEWDAAVALARDFPNVYLELCAVLDERGVLEKFVSELGSEKIVFGTDMPWFNYHNYIGAVLGAEISDEDRRNVLYRNAKKLLNGL